jgi:FRG domain
MFQPATHGLCSPSDIDFTTVEAQLTGRERFDDIGARDPAMEIDTAEVSGWGSVWAPQTPLEVMRLIESPTWGGEGPVAWRGQSEGWPLHSGAVRRLRDDFALGRTARMPDAAEGLVADYERVLVDRARLAGHGEASSGRQRSDLELLGLLQHFGAATRLVDFSYNGFIALWFACRHEPTKFGILIRLDLGYASEVRTSEDLNTSITSLRDREGLSYWEPLALSPRMSVQSALFVWSKVRASATGSLGYGPDDEVPTSDTSKHSIVGPGIAAFAVSPALKAGMGDIWDSVFGHDEQRLFPDLEGFAQFHAAGRSFPPGFFGTP